MEQIKIAVIAMFDTQGEITPLKIGCPDGRKLEIENICEVHKDFPLQPGYTCTKFTCEINSKIYYLYYNKLNNLWLLEQTS